MIRRDRNQQRIERVADEVLSNIGEKGRYGSAILTWIIVQIAVIVAKKLLERIIADDGKQVVAIAKSLLDNVEENQTHPFGEEQ